MNQRKCSFLYFSLWKDVQGNALSILSSSQMFQLLNVFIYEWRHWIKNKRKIFSFVLFFSSAEVLNFFQTEIVQAENVSWQTFKSDFDQTLFYRMKNLMKSTLKWIQMTFWLNLISKIHDFYFNRFWILSEDFVNQLIRNSLLNKN